MWEAELVMEWVMECVMGGLLVPTSVVPMGMWLVWRREVMLGMGKGIEGGKHVEDMAMMMMVCRDDLMDRIDVGYGAGGSGG